MKFLELGRSEKAIQERCLILKLRVPRTLEKYQEGQKLPELYPNRFHRSNAFPMEKFFWKLFTSILVLKTAQLVNLYFTVL